MHLDFLYIVLLVLHKSWWRNAVAGSRRHKYTFGYKIQYTIQLQYILLGGEGGVWRRRRKAKEKKEKKNCLVEE